MSKPASIYGGRLRLYSPACALLGALRCLAASQVAPPVHGVFYYTRYYTPTPTVSTSRLDRRPIRGGCAVPLIKPMANHHAFSRAPADYLCYRGWPGCFGCHARSSSSALRGLLVLPLPFGALAAWLDRMLMQTAAALTIRLLPTRLAGVLGAEPRTAEGTLISGGGRPDRRPPPIGAPVWCQWSGT